MFTGLLSKAWPAIVGALSGAGKSKVASVGNKTAGGGRLILFCIFVVLVLDMFQVPLRMTVDQANSLWGLFEIGCLAQFLGAGLAGAKKLIDGIRGK